MANIEALLAKASELGSLLTRMAHGGKRILVVTHIDADGLSSGAIVFRALARKGAVVSVRAVPDLDPATIEALKGDSFDCYVFTDLASGLLGELGAAFRENYFVVDHHQLPSGETRGPPNVLNAWNFEYDGGSEACSATMAYMLATALDGENKDLAHLAIVGAMGDRQDSGDGRSLLGLNRHVLDQAVARGSIGVSNDFLFYGRETRPVHEAIGMTYSPMIPGLSGSKDAALAALSNSGFKVKAGGRWRTIAELSTEEKKLLLDVLTSFLVTSSTGGSVVSELIGSVFTLPAEDSFTPLRDAREFAAFLNACGRMDRTDVGMAVCLGDRELALAEGMKLAAEYRTKINRALQVVQSDQEKTQSFGGVVLVNGEDFLEERLTGSISSSLASSNNFREKVILVRARSGDSSLKFSTRFGDGYRGAVNLGQVMREAAEEVGGIGGGHSMAAGAKIPLMRADDFTRAVLKKVPPSS
jgi:single-stranded-DNA-specific exonuclease